MFGSVTNTDCEKCILSHLADISTDYEEHQWQCLKKHHIEYTTKDKKGCGLPPGEYYAHVITNIEKRKQNKVKKGINLRNRT